MKFTVKMANMKIGVDSQYDRLQEYCKDYCIPECEPDFCVKMELEEIVAEGVDNDELNFENEYLETVALLRKIAERFPLYNRVLCHGASITYGDQGAFLFTAPSGTGKTTHVRLWKRILGEPVNIVNGDKPFLEVREDGVQIYGSPWAGKEGFHQNRDAQLKGICFLKRGTQNSIRRLEPWECLASLMSQVHIPKEKEAAGKALELIEKILEKVPVYELICDISTEAVKCSFEAMTGLKYEENI